MPELYINRQGLHCPNCHSTKTHYDSVYETWGCQECGLNKMDIQEWWWYNGIVAPQ